LRQSSRTALRPDCAAVVMPPQLPTRRYLIVWTATERAEFGDWDGDQVKPALAFIAEILAGPR
jgi:hypothetical protein